MGAANGESNGASCLVTFSPAEIVKHQMVAWPGIRGDVTHFTTQARFEFDYRAPCHLLIASEGGGRREGEVAVEGLPRTKLGNLSRQMVFIPAGYPFHAWRKPSAPAIIPFFYIDPRGPLVDPELRFVETEFKPHLFFFEHDLWETAAKLKAQVENGGAGGRQYIEALTIALAHELVRVNNRLPPTEGMLRGGLAAWQQKRVADYIEEHVADEIPLATLAGLVQLSRYHFVRVFKHSFGMPPHRYHVSRRIEHAKNFLARPGLSVTEIAFKVGFGEASSLSEAFRKFTGRTPIDYRRHVE